MSEKLSELTKQPIENSALPAAAIVAAGLLWGTMSLFTRPMGDLGLTPLQISFLRAALSSLILFVYLLIKDRAALRIRLRDIWMFVGTGIVSLALFNWCYFTTIEKGEASVAVCLLYTSPVFVMLFSAVLFGEQITRKKLTALVLSLLGAVLVSGLLSGAGGGQMTPALFVTGIGSGLFYAMYSIFSRFALARYPFLTVVFYTFVFASLGMLPLCGAGEACRIAAGSGGAVLLTCGIALAATILPYLFYTAGLASTENGKASILATSEILMGSLIGIFFYHEPHGAGKILGILCIFAAVVLLNTGHKKSPQ